VLLVVLFFNLLVTSPCIGKMEYENMRSLFRVITKNNKEYHAANLRPDRDGEAQGRGGNG
jgi:hypothetical protein